MLNFLGYLINIILLFVIISCIVRLFMDYRGKDLEDLPVGHVVREVTDWILKKICSILTIKEEITLLWIIIVVSIVLMGFFKAVFIK